MSKPLTVVVTGLGGGGLGEQILKALRLSSIPYRIIGCDVDRNSKGLQQVDRPYLVPLASDPEYLASVLAVCRTEQARALFPGSEAEVRILSRHRARIEEAGVFCPMNPAEVIETCLDKARTMEAIARLGFHCPRTVRIRTPQDLALVDFLPVVLKPSVGGGGSANVLLAQTRDEMASFADHLLRNGAELIAQQYVGTVDSEYTVGVLFSMDGDLLNSIAMRRQLGSAFSTRLKAPNRTGNPDLGPVLAISTGISQGELGPYPEVTRPCEALASALGCRGAVNIQCRLVKGQVQVFEINPRFSGTTSARALVGYNEPDVLIRIHILGERIAARFPYRSGVVLRGLSELLIEGREVRDARRLP